MILAALFFAFPDGPSMQHVWSWTDCLPPNMQMPILSFALAACYAIGYVSRTFPPQFQAKWMVMLYVLAIGELVTIGLMVPGAAKPLQMCIYAVGTGLTVSTFSTFTYDLFIKALGQKVVAIIYAITGTSSVKEPVEPDPQNQPNKKDQDL